MTIRNARPASEPYVSPGCGIARRLPDVAAFGKVCGALRRRSGSFMKKARYIEPSLLRTYSLIWAENAIFGSTDSNGLCGWHRPPTYLKARQQKAPMSDCVPQNC